MHHLHLKAHALLLLSSSSCCFSSSSLLISSFIQTCMPFSLALSSARGRCTSIKELSISLIHHLLTGLFGNWQVKSQPFPLKFLFQVSSSLQLHDFRHPYPESLTPQAVEEEPTSTLLESIGFCCLDYSRSTRSYWPFNQTLWQLVNLNVLRVSKLYSSLYPSWQVSSQVSSFSSLVLFCNN